MRTLPWRTNTNRKHPEGDGNTITKEENPDESETQDEEYESETQDEEDEGLNDTMIPGYDHDDAYIMVEHDLLEAAKQVTCHIHRAAYQKHVSAPMPNNQDIQRPTTGHLKLRPHVHGISDDEEDDLTILSELLRKPPVPKTVAITLLKRKKRSPKLMNWTGNDANENNPISKNANSGTVTEGAEVYDADDDEDDEDLTRPCKRVWPTVILQLTCRFQT